MAVRTYYDQSYPYKMPNQRDIIYTKFSHKITTEGGEEWLHIKQHNLGVCPVIRQYQIRLRNIINTYIEGPFGCYDECGEPRDDMWRFVIVATRMVDGCIGEREIVLNVPTKEYALDVLKSVTDRLGF